MAQIVGGYGISHTAMAIRRYDSAIPAEARIRAEFEQLQKAIEALAPDCIVMVSSEHLKTFFYDNFPQICVGLGNTCRGWGDAGVAAADVPIAGDLASYLVEFGINAGFDLSWAVEPRLDHGFMCPLTLLTPKMNIPIVPIFTNSSTAPLPPLSRYVSLGKMIKAAVESYATTDRVVLIAAGGLSHWIATNEMGQINETFDRWFLNCVEKGDLSALAELSNADIAVQGGNGGQEIRNWVTIMAAGSGPGKILCYEPIQRWATGMALARLFEK